MSYMYLVLRPESGDNDTLLLMEVPTEWKEGRFVPTGPSVMRYTPDSDLQSMLHGHDDTPPMDPVALPDGWLVASSVWLPTRYVPRSLEVRKHARKEAVDYMLGRGLITDAVAKQILEDPDA